MPKQSLLPLILLVTLAIDILVRKPLGIQLLRRLAGYSDHGPSTKSCAWDLEGHWQIGTMANGKSPWQWKAKDEWIFIANGDDNTRETDNLHNRQVRRSSRTKQQQSRNTIDVSLGTINCADIGTSPAASFVADPFLLQKSSTEWYTFFELKNLRRYIGEIGVSKSTDAGQTWAFQGVALEEAFHLSYPFVIKDDKRHKYYMIPETNEAREVRVYETSEDQFPFGWRFVHTPLKGGRFVDTAAVWHDGRYWIYTTALASALDPFGVRKSTLKLLHRRSIGNVDGASSISNRYKQSSDREVRGAASSAQGQCLPFRTRGYRRLWGGSTCDQGPCADSDLVSRAGDDVHSSRRLGSGTFSSCGCT